MNKKIIFSAGGTGGHIFPAINLIEHFFDKNYEILLVTDVRGERFIKKLSNIKYYQIKAGTFTNKNILKKIFSVFIICHSIVKSIFILKREKPDLILGFGGYVSFPISFASIFFKIPLVIYENNLVLGRANKYLGFFSKKILVAREITNNYPPKYKYKTHEVGSILKKNILNYSNNRKNNNDIFSILVLGGSQGAEIFGKIVPDAVKMIKEKGYKVKIIQQCTKNQKNSIIEFYNKNNIDNYVFEFEEDIMNLISSVNLAITRCGASTTAELVNFLTPFIAVPLPNSIDNHQHLNAQYYQKKGCCWLLDQNNFNTKNLFNLIMENIKNQNKLEDMRENMKKNQTKMVYEKIEKEINKFI